jgi:uncharacterized membrane-anchored protein
MLTMKRPLLLLTLLLFSFLTRANDPSDSLITLRKAMEHVQDSISKTLNYATGKIKTDGGEVALDIPEGFKYLNKEQSIFVLTKIWGNPESATKDVIGMIFPEKFGPYTDSSYAFVVTYEEIGYVKDEDAGKIDYDQLLKTIQEDEKKENEERTKAGFPEVHMVGWAEKPYYDSQRKILHWAKELKFGNGDDDNTLNYEVRILGRKGMISMNAVSKMYSLPLVNQDISKVLSVASFTQGNSYFDFDSKTDKIAVWTIGGLVAGHLLAKAGILAVIAKFLAPLWKFIVLFFAGIGAWFKRKLGRKKNDDSPVYPPATPDSGEEAIPEMVSASDNAAHAQSGDPEDHTKYLPS